MGANIFFIPSFFASSILLRRRWGALRRPVSDTSPSQTTSRNTLFVLDESIAAAIATSIPGSGESESSCNICIDITGVERYLCMLDESCDDEIEFACIDTSSWSLRIAKFCGCDEGFYLDQKWSCSLNCHGDDRSRILMREIDEFHTSIDDIMKPVFFHAKKSDLISRPKSILKRSKDTIILPFFPFEKEHCIYEMFHHLWSWYRSVFGHMSNEENTLSSTLCEFHIWFTCELEAGYRS